MYPKSCHLKKKMVHDQEVLCLDFYLSELGGAWERTETACVHTHWNLASNWSNLVIKPTNQNENLGSNHTHTHTTKQKESYGLKKFNILSSSRLNRHQWKLELGLLPLRTKAGCWSGRGAWAGNEVLLWLPPYPFLSPTKVRNNIIILIWKYGISLIFTNYKTTANVCTEGPMGWWSSV